MDVESEITSLKVAVARVETMAERTEGTVNRLDEKFDQLLERLSEHFVPRGESDQAQKNVDARLDAVESDIRDLRKRAGHLPAWATAVGSVMVAIVSAVLGGYYHL